MTKKQYFLIAGLLVIVFIFLLFFIFHRPASHSRSPMPTPSASATPPPMETTPTPAPDIFTTSNPTFYNPVLLPGAYVDNTSSELIDSSKQNILIKSYMGTIRLYHVSTRESTVIDKNAVLAKFSDDGKFVYYVKQEQDTIPLEAFDLTTSKITKITELPKGSKPISLASASGIIYYTYSINNVVNLQTIFFSAYASQYPAAPLPTSFNNVSSVLAESKGKIFTVNDPAHLVEAFTNPLNKLPAFSFPKNIFFSKSYLLGVNPSNTNYDIVFSDTSNNSRVFTKDGVIPDFKNVFDAAWFDDHTLLVIEKFNLYAYDTTTQKSQLLVNNVTRFSTSSGTIYVQTKEIYKIDIKK